MSTTKPTKPYKQARRNQILILGFEFLWGMGAPFVLATTVMSGYLDSLGAPKILVGAVPAVYFGGIAVVQPLSLSLISPGPNRYKKMIWAYRLGILGYTTMAVLTVLLPQNAYSLRMGTFFLCYVWYVLIAGSGDPHYMKAVIDSINPAKRGTFFAYRMMAIGCGGLAGGEATRRLLKHLPYPTNFGASMLLGSAVLMIATIWFAAFTPTVSETSEKQQKALEYLKDVKRLITGDKGYLRFIFVLFFMVAIQGCAAFVALSIRDKLDMGDGILGRLGSIDALSGMLFAFILGKIGDLINHKSSYVFGILLYTVGLSIVLLTDSYFSLQVGYLLAGCATSVWTVSAINMGLDYSSGIETSRVYASINVTAVPFKILGPIGAGAIVSKWGYNPMLITTACAAFFSIFIALTLPNPKKRTSQ